MGNILYPPVCKLYPSGTTGSGIGTINPSPFTHKPKNISPTHQQVQQAHSAQIPAVMAQLQFPALQHVYKIGQP
jgi:hypothetical protein